MVDEKKLKEMGGSGKSFTPKQFDLICSAMDWEEIECNLAFLLEEGFPNGLPRAELRKHCMAILVYPTGDFLGGEDWGDNTKEEKNEV